MITNICLVRYGETEWNRIGRLQGMEDVELNETGKDQARRCGEYLAKESWDLIMSSPLKRARETAGIIREFASNTRMFEMHELIERDYGAASGLTHEEVARKYPDDYIPGIERRSDLVFRAINALNGIVKQHSGCSIIVVSHGAVINAILSELSGGEIGSGKTVLKNSCFSTLKHYNDRWEITSYNLTDHLE